MSLHVTRFSGVVLAGGADSRSTDELLRADSVDIDPRGAIVAASDNTDFAPLLDFSGAKFQQLLALHPISGVGATQIFAVGTGVSNIGFAYLFALVSRHQAGAVPWVGGSLFGGVYPPHDVLPLGCYVSCATLPGQFQVKFPGQPIEFITPFYVNIGAREGTAPIVAPGLYAVFKSASSATITATQIAYFDALGTGPDGELAVSTNGASVGTMSRQLRPRGILAHNGYLFLWGFDGDDTSKNDGPNLVMFCNLGNPLKYGNDNGDDQTVDRVFTDSDRMFLGAAGELIRAGISYRGRAFFGTDRGLHFISGFGRDSFLTDGSTPIVGKFNVTGPGSLVIGPDDLLYGLGDDGLWSFDGNGVPSPEFLKLRDVLGNSPGYWDCLWTDPTTGGAVPGTTNKDLVWMATDTQRGQVLIGIPYCNGRSGGRGADTVVVKFHPHTKGFTREVFRNVSMTAAGYFRRASGDTETRFMGLSNSGAKATIQRYGFVSPSLGTAVMPSEKPRLTFGEYAPFGPDGRGIVRRVYVTLSWDPSRALPLTFAVAVFADQSESDRFLITLSPTAPALPSANDLWLDTSNTAAGLGNSTASTTVAPIGGYLLNYWNGLDWKQISGSSGQGSRATLALPLKRRMAARFTFDVDCMAAAGRFSIEGFGFVPPAGDKDA